MSHFLRSVLTFLLIVGFHTVSASHLFAQVPAAQAQGQVLVDEMNPDNTPILEALAACLPAHDSYANSTHYTILSTADLAAASGTSRFYYIQVSYKDAEGKLLPNYFQSLLEVTPANQCIGHITRSGLDSLDQFVPTETAVQFAKARFTYLQQFRPSDYQEMVDYYRAGGFTTGQAERPSDNVGGCQVLAVDAAALQELGVSLASSCQIVDRFTFR